MGRKKGSLNIIPKMKYRTGFRLSDSEFREVMDRFRDHIKKFGMTTDKGKKKSFGWFIRQRLIGKL